MSGRAPQASSPLSPLSHDLQQCWTCLSAMYSSVGCVSPLGHLLKLSSLSKMPFPPTPSPSLPSLAWLLIILWDTVQTRASPSVPGTAGDPPLCPHVSRKKLGVKCIPVTITALLTLYCDSLLVCLLSFFGMLAHSCKSRKSSVPDTKLHKRDDQKGLRKSCK